MHKSVRLRNETALLFLDFYQRLGRSVSCSMVEGRTVETIQRTELGVADTRSILQHSLEHRLKIARRRTDDAQHIRRRSLLLQRFAQLTRALLLRLEEPNILDRNQRMVGE